jgi:hypothetical protein
MGIMFYSINFKYTILIAFVIALFLLISGAKPAYSECKTLCDYERGIASVWGESSFKNEKNGLLPGPSYEVALNDSGYSEQDLKDDNLMMAANDGDTQVAYIDGSPNKWHFSVAPYLWMAAMNGKLGVKGQTVDLDIPFSDILDQLDIAGQVHMEAWKDKFGFFVDATYMKIVVRDGVQLRQDRSVDIKNTTEFFLGELGGFYRVGTWPFGPVTTSYKKNTKTTVTLDLIGGGRYWWMENTVNINGPINLNPEFSGSESWFDFIVGGRVIIDINKLFVSLRSDVGGFGLGFSSDISWNIAGYIGYELPWYKITPIIGYRALYDKYSDGSGDDRFLWDAWMYGPALGVAFQF